MMKKEPKYATVKSQGDDIETGTVSTESSSLPVAKAVAVKDRPAVITAVLVKETPDSPLGISWVNQSSPNTGIEIKTIVSGGLGDNWSIENQESALRPGMKLLSVNGNDYQRCISRKELLESVASISRLEGDVTLLLTDRESGGYVSAAAPSSPEDEETGFVDEPIDIDPHKTKSPAPRLGLNLSSLTGSRVIVKSIDSGSPFVVPMKLSRTKLRKEDRILMINGVDVSTNRNDNLETAERILEEISPGEMVTIVFEGTYVQSTAVSTTRRGRGAAPPRGVAAGGVWGSVAHRGDSTCCWGFVCCLLCGLLPSLIVCCNPFDRRLAYKTDSGCIYDASGILIGYASSSNLNFEEGEMTGNVNSSKQQEILTIAFVVGFIFSIVYIAINLSAGAY